VSDLSFHGEQMPWILVGLPFTSKLRYKPTFRRSIRSLSSGSIYM